MAIEEVLLCEIPPSFCGKSTEAGFVEVNLSCWEDPLKLLNVKVLVLCLEAKIGDRLIQILSSTLVFFD